MAAYYVLAVLLMRNYTDSTVNARYTLWPTWGWALGMGSALLWFLAGLFACCARPPPPRSCRMGHFWAACQQAPPRLNGTPA